MCDPAAGNGAVYVRERGHLRRANGIVLAEAKSVSSCRRTHPFVLKKEHFMFTYNAEGSLRYSAKSLFDVTLLFIADNIQHVDSLIDFPEQIGDKLFAAAEEKQVFSNQDVAPKALKLFNDAYGDTVLGSLCLRNRCPLLNERMEEIKTFHSLKSLDLFGCRLGDDHDIFQHLTSSSLASNLIRLFIGGNRLSDAGVQRLTAPIRMMRKGLDCLQLLDVSYNPISERAIRYLACLPKLEKLDVSGTRLMPGVTLKTTVWNLLGLTHSEKPLDDFDLSKCKTEGWAEQVISQWEASSAQTQHKQKKIEESRTSALRFFGRQKFVRDVLNATPLVLETEEEAATGRLHFYKPAANTPKPDFETPTIPTANQTSKVFQVNSMKRPRQSDSCDGLDRNPPPKRVLTIEDFDLLNSY
ncbi:leucine-rich repeat-containing protein 42 [Genypterus blacodes]|uniref:leucine-rich repeat-containing protein 42 n=1 Tax=Genypterus blacodes TaxID=154954 RepID=UPI003F7762FB